MVKTVTRSDVREPRVLVIAHGGERKPSTRLRILQYLPVLEDAGLRFETLFVPQGGHGRPIRRFDEKLEWADVVFVQRVLTREVLRKVRRSAKPVIFDIDDALHYIRQSQYPDAIDPRGITQRIRNAYRRAVRGSRFYSSQKRHLDEMLEIATTTIVGNAWLFDELGLTEKQAVIIPTSVWVNGVPRKRHHQHFPVTLGWIGVRSNLYHLEGLQDAFSVLRNRYRDGVELNIVSSGTVQTPLRTRFTPWSLESESASVLSFDIGLMPLQNDPFSRGKCAFKAVFCMSRGVPVVASPVGANTAVIEQGVNGWLASGTDEWIEAISTLVDDAALRGQMGRQARATIEEGYSAAEVATKLGDIVRRTTDSWSEDSTERDSQKSTRGHSG
jgi:glycosyltransferase involved in cell wall biosynthesis